MSQLVHEHHWTKFCIVEKIDFLGQNSVSSPGPAVSVWTVGFWDDSVKKRDIFNRPFFLLDQFCRDSSPKRGRKVLGHPESIMPPSFTHFVKKSNRGPISPGPAICRSNSGVLGGQCQKRDIFNRSIFSCTPIVPRFESQTWTSSVRTPCKYHATKFYTFDQKVESWSHFRWPYWWGKSEGSQKSLYFPKKV